MHVFFSVRAYVVYRPSQLQQSFSVTCCSCFRMRWCTTVKTIMCKSPQVWELTLCMCELKISTTAWVVEQRGWHQKKTQKTQLMVSKMNFSMQVWNHSASQFQVESLGLMHQGFFCAVLNHNPQAYCPGFFYACTCTNLHVFILLGREATLTRLFVLFLFPCPVTTWQRRCDRTFWTSSRLVIWTCFFLLCSSRYHCCQTVLVVLSVEFPSTSVGLGRELSLYRI